DAVGRRRNRIFDLRRRPLSTDEPLGRGDRVLGVGDRLPLRDMSDQAFAGLGQGHHRWRRLVAAAVGYDDGFVIVHDGNARVGRAKVNTNHAFHEEVPLARRRPTSGAWTAPLSYHLAATSRALARALFLPREEGPRQRI